MRHIWKPCATSGEGGPAEAESVQALPPPVSVGGSGGYRDRGHFTLQIGERFRPATSFAKIPPQDCPKSTYRLRRISHRRPAARARVKEFKVLTRPSSTRQCRSGAPDAGPCLHRHTQTSVFDPTGCFRSYRLTFWRDFSIGSVNARMTQTLVARCPKQSPPAGWYGC